VGLVIVSTVIVAVLVEWLAPGFGWASAFVLGAIVSPPDAVAAGAIFERFGVPRRVLAILDGEGLLNDGTALVIYRFAVFAAVVGNFSLPRASMAFVIVVTLASRPASSSRSRSKRCCGCCAGSNSATRRSITSSC